MRRPKSDFLDRLLGSRKERYELAHTRSSPALRRRWVHETILERRIFFFKRLIFTPLLASLALLGTAATPSLSRTCFSWLVGSAVAVVLELIGSYYLAGLAVSYTSWIRFGPFDRLLMLRLSILGIAGATASIASATTLLAGRCSL